MKAYIKDYCTGCGLCSSVKNTSMVATEDGFLHCEFDENDDRFYMEVCPASGKQIQRNPQSSIWGNGKIYLGWSNNEIVRQKASSGGVLTETLSYLIDSGKVEAVIQTKSNDKIPWETELVLSTTREEIIRNCGSRYSDSASLCNISELLNRYSTFAYVGKPCDVIALKNYMQVNQVAKKKILYTLSFFCAGVPSRNANRTLLKKMGCKVEDCISLNYRGNGWPGFATAADKYGKEYTLPYEEAWGKILGRDIRKSCRFCFDGIGLEADISCCDAWYQNESGKPDFSEKEGRNAIFTRTNNGEQIIREMKEIGLITAVETEFDESLNKIQAYQKERRATMLVRILALKLTLKSTPKYPTRELIKFVKAVGLRRQWQIFKGTIKRICEGKI